MKKYIIIGILAAAMTLAGGCAKDQAKVSYIGADAAKQLALQDADRTAGQVVFEGTDMGTRNGMDYYHIAFTDEENSYEYDIEALTGTVITSRVTSLDRMAQPAPGTSESSALAQNDTEGQNSGGTAPNGSENQNGTGPAQNGTDGQSGAENANGTNLAQGGTENANGGDAAQNGSGNQDNAQAAQNGSGNQNNAQAAQNGSGNQSGTQAAQNGSGNQSGTQAAQNGSGNQSGTQAAQNGSGNQGNGTISSGTTPSRVAETPAAPAATAAQSGTLTEAEAKAKALAHAGLTSDQVTFFKCVLDWDDGRQVYDIEFYDGNYTEYDYEIDPNTGDVVSYDHDTEYVPAAPSGGNRGPGYTESQSPSASAGGSTTITADQAKQLALSQVPGATVNDIREFETDYDDGRMRYEGKIYYGGMEYEFEIDAYSGAICGWDAEVADRHD